MSGLDQKRRLPVTHHSRRRFGRQAAGSTAVVAADGGGGHRLVGKGPFVYVGLVSMAIRVNWVQRCPGFLES